MQINFIVCQAGKDPISVGGENMVFEKLQELIAEQFSVSVESVTMDTSFADDLGADSLDIVELMMALEEEFDISEAEEEELVKLQTVGDVVAYISGHIE